MGRACTAGCEPKRTAARGGTDAPGVRGGTDAPGVRGAGIQAGRAGMRWRAGDFECVVSTQAGRAGARSSWLYSFPRLDAMRTGRAHRVCAAGAQAGRAREKAKERRNASARAGTGPGVQERAAAGFTASPASTRCAQAGRAGSAGKERRAARVWKSEKTARCVRPRRNRAGRTGGAGQERRGARGERRKNGAMRPPAQEQGRACRSAQQLALQLSPPRRDAHRPGAQGAQGKKGARRVWGKAKERRDASARAGTGPDTARGGGEQGGAEPKKPARKGRAHRSGLRGRQSGAEIEGEMRREQPRTGAAARRSRGNEPCVAAARKRGMRAEKSGNRRDCPPVRMGAPVARKHGKGKRGCLGGLDGWGDRARHPVAGGGVQKKRCSAGRAADRAKRERTTPPPVQAAKKAALSLPPSGTKGCRKSGARYRWQDGWVKKEVRPGGGGEKDKRERRRCAQRRRWKIPQKAASDEPFGKHCFGDRARYRWPGGRVKEEARLGRAGERRTKGNGGAARSAAVSKPRRRPPQTSPSASIVSATVRGIVGRAAG